MKLKILIVTRTMTFGGGAEGLIFDTFREMKTRKDVVVKLLSLEDSVIYDKHNGNLFELALANDPDFQIIDANVQLGIIRPNALNIGPLQKIIDDFEPDFIHSHMYKAELISRSCHYPKAVWFSHCHDNMVQFDNLSLRSLFNFRKLTNFYEKLYLKKRYAANGGTRFIAISRDARVYCQRTFGNYEVHLLPNAIDTARFSAQKAQVYQRGQLRLINIGSFVEKKNQRLLLPVLKALLHKGWDAHLTLVGDGPMMADVKEEVSMMGLANHVNFAGTVPDVERLLWDAHIYVHSATYEPFGLVLLEAMAAGLPVVALDGKGNRDLIEDGENGVMVWQNDPSVFAQAIMDLADNPIRLQTMVKKASAHSIDFGIESYVDKLLNLYRSGKTK